MPQCSAADFGDKEVIVGTGFFTTPLCKAETVIGENKATVYAGENGVAPGVSDLPLSGNVYNLKQREGLASEFGVALKLPKPGTEKISAKSSKGSKPEVEKQQYFAHTLIEGNVEWGQEANGTNQGDYHDYFEIDVSPALPLISSRLVFKGRSGNGAFITNATSCPGHNTTTPGGDRPEGTTVAKRIHDTDRTEKLRCGPVRTELGADARERPRSTNRTKSRRKSASRVTRQKKSTAPS